MSAWTQLDTVRGGDEQLCPNRHSGSGRQQLCSNGCCRGRR